MYEGQRGVLRSWEELGKGRDGNKISMVQKYRISYN